MACLEPTTSDSLGGEKFVDRERESSGRFANAEVADGKKSVRSAGPRRGSRRTPESMHEVKRIIGKRGQRREKLVKGGAEMETKESGLGYLSRMTAVEKLKSIKRELMKVKQDH